MDKIQHTTTNPTSKIQPGQKTNPSSQRGPKVSKTAGEAAFKAPTSERNIEASTSLNHPAKAIPAKKGDINLIPSDGLDPVLLAAFRDKMDTILSKRPLKHGVHQLDFSTIVEAVPEFLAVFGHDEKAVRSHLHTYGLKVWGWKSGLQNGAVSLMIGLGLLIKSKDAGGWAKFGEFNGYALGATFITAAILLMLIPLANRELPYDMKIADEYRNLNTFADISKMLQASTDELRPLKEELDGLQKDPKTGKVLPKHQARADELMAAIKEKWEASDKAIGQYALRVLFVNMFGQGNKIQGGIAAVRFWIVLLAPLLFGAFNNPIGGAASQSAAYGASVLLNPAAAAADEVPKRYGILAMKMLKMREALEGVDLNDEKAVAKAMATVRDDYVVPFGHDDGADDSLRIAINEICSIAQLDPKELYAALAESDLEAQNIKPSEISADALGQHITSKMSSLTVSEGDQEIVAGMIAGWEELKAGRMKVEGTAARDPFIRPPLKGAIMKGFSNFANPATAYTTLMQANAKFLQWIVANPTVSLIWAADTGIAYDREDPNGTLKHYTEILKLPYVAFTVAVMMYLGANMRHVSAAGGRAIATFFNMLGLSAVTQTQFGDGTYSMSRKNKENAWNEAAKDDPDLKDMFSKASLGRAGKTIFSDIFITYTEGRQAKAANKAYEGNLSMREQLMQLINDHIPEGPARDDFLEFMQKITISLPVTESTSTELGELLPADMLPTIPPRAHIPAEGLLGLAAEDAQGDEIRRG